MKRLIASLLLTGLLTGCGSSSSNFDGEHSPDTIQREGAVQWVDVRTLAEFNAGHIPGAIHLPYDEIQADHVLIQKDELNREDTLYLYCRSGRRSRIAQSSFEKLGFQVKDIGSFSAAKQMADSLFE
ncbi:rhodanese-like domain-containing protein [Kiritimatiellaeota bacterium B1221]|nr:rhodanese-like domain-containing protein [Kiritimatiellaeota bacterium B1221]